MLKLRSVTALLIHQRWVSLDNALVDQVVQAEKILVLAEAVEVTATKWQSTEGLLNYAQDVLGRGEAKVDLSHVWVETVVGTFELDGS